MRNLSLALTYYSHMSSTSFVYQTLPTGRTLAIAILDIFVQTMPAEHVPASEDNATLISVIAHGTCQAAF
jgi:hypothetical protein